MLRDSFMSKRQEAGFRWRGHEIARIEGLSDAVFAFAVTLLVVSLEVPKTFNELAALMRGFVPFAISFGLLMQIWHEQYRYFRRYNLQDSLSTFLNAILLFVVLFYVYPLKFLWTFLITSWTSGGQVVRVHLPNGEMERMIEPHQVGQLMGIFSGGYLAVSCIFLLLFLHAFRRREQLELDVREVHLTRVSIGAVTLQAVTAIASLGFVAFGGERFGGFAGIIYPILLGPGFTIYYSVMARKERRLTA
jgi:phosphatidylglycerophosphate synthase